MKGGKEERGKRREDENSNHIGVGKVYRAGKGNRGRG